MAVTRFALSAWLLAGACAPQEDAAISDLHNRVLEIQVDIVNLRSDLARLKTVSEELDRRIDDNRLSDEDAFDEVAARRALEFMRSERNTVKDRVESQ